jgi:hypothetical protein
MNRRDVLKLGAVAGTASSCATVLSAETPVVPESLSALFAKLDAQLRELARGPVLAGFVSDLPNHAEVHQAPGFPDAEQLAQKTLKAFLIATTFQSVTPEQWKEPLAVDRLQASMADLDEGVLGMTAMLEGLSDADRRRLGHHLRENPDLGMRVMGSIDEQAGRYGVSTEGRLKLRAASMNATSRLRQSPALFLTDTTTKVRKLEVRHGVSEEARRRLGASVLAMALFDQQPAEQPASGGTPSPPPPPPDVAPEAMVTPSDARGPVPVGETPKQRQVRQLREGGVAVMTVGGIALGVTGLVVLGSVLTGNSLLGATIGILAGIAGLITLIVGLIIFLAAR